MEAVDYRNATWDTVRNQLVKLRLAAYVALREHGPCTTRDLASRSGMDILTVRPRVTELCQLGCVCLVDEESSGHEGTYRALSIDEARELFARRREAAIGVPVQTELNIAG